MMDILLDLALLLGGAWLVFSGVFFFVGLSNFDRPGDAISAALWAACLWIAAVVAWWNW